MFHPPYIPLREQSPEQQRADRADALRWQQHLRDVKRTERAEQAARAAKRYSPVEPTLVRLARERAFPAVDMTNRTLGR